LNFLIKKLEQRLLS